MITFSYSFMITVRSLQVIEDDLFTLRLPKEPREPERPLSRSLSFSNSSFRAGLESTSLIKVSMSAICLSVSSRRFRAETVVVVESSVDIDVPETVVSAVVEPLVENLTVVDSLSLVLPSVDAIDVVSLVVLETDVLIPSVDVLLKVVLPLVVLLMVVLPRIVLPVVVLPLELLVSVVLSTEVLPVVLRMVDVPSVELLVVPLVVGLPTDVLVAIVLPSSVL